MLTMQPLLVATAPKKQLYVGIDVSKSSHMAALISPDLLRQHRKFEKCPTLPFENNRAGFEKLTRVMTAQAPLERCSVLLERTGHYHRALMEYLAEIGVEVYEIQVQKSANRDKSDKRDALGLANALYNQLGLGATPDEPSRRIRSLAPPSQAAIVLHSLVIRHEKLSREMSQRNNHLIAIVDQLFPEFFSVLKTVDAQSTLNLLAKYPSHSDITEASIEDLHQCCPGRRPGKTTLAKLQEVAKRSIGTKDPARTASLGFEQVQIISEIRVLRGHIEAIETRITEIVEATREGQILLSLPMIGPVAAAAIIASIGNIANFEGAAQLKNYFGWAPRSHQTGVSADSSVLKKQGNHSLRRMMYLIAWRAIKGDTEWCVLYERLVPKKCQWDARLQRYLGRNKVIGRICGQIVTLIFYLLRKDYDMLRALKPGDEVPEPTLYSREIHNAHRQTGRAKLAQSAHSD